MFVVRVFFYQVNSERVSDQACHEVGRLFLKPLEMHTMHGKVKGEGGVLTLK